MRRFWWRWRESNPRPKTVPQGFLRVQLLFWDSPHAAPNNRLCAAVAFCVWQLKGVGCSQEPLSTPCPVPRYSRADELHQAAKATLLLSFVLKLRLFKRRLTATRLPSFAVPVETFTSPSVKLKIESWKWKVIVYLTSISRSKSSHSQHNPSKLILFPLVLDNQLLSAIWSNTLFLLLLSKQWIFLK